MSKSAVMPVSAVAGSVVENESLRRRRIALFDYRVIPTNPVGSCHRRLLDGLCEEYDFTVFAVQFDNPNPGRIRWVRIPAPIRPYVLLYLTYHLLAPLTYVFYRWRTGERFDLVQMVESNLGFGDVAYSHFCHRAYLKHHWRDTRATGLRGFLRWVSHRAAALLEPVVYRGVRHLVVPSQGLERELRAEYQGAGAKTLVLPNPVDIDRMRAREGFKRGEVRASAGAGDSDLVVTFIALGHFERKGLPLLLDALHTLADTTIKLVVVGGEAGTVTEWKERARELGLAAQVHFTGAQRDVRPYLWASDVFALPSCYEVFPLVSLEAAAASLPLLVTALNGVEEFLIDGWNGLLIERTVSGVADGLARFRAMTADERRAMGEQAFHDVGGYATSHFVERWREFYESQHVA